MIEYSLGKLPLLRTGKSRSINWENRTGEREEAELLAVSLDPPEKVHPVSLLLVPENVNACRD